jgi:hypothetical protein
MRKLLGDFWRDDRGCVPAMEWVFVASILTLGTVAGLLFVQHSRDADLPERPPALMR